MGNDMKKYSLHSIFTFYLNRDISVLELFPVVVLKKNLNEVRVDWQLKQSLKLLDCSRNDDQNDVHIDTYYCKPQLIA